MENDKKAYAAPDLTELGEFTKLTQCGSEGEEPDAGYPDNFPDIYGS
jgi:hypothetical protein